MNNHSTSLTTSILEMAARNPLKSRKETQPRSLVINELSCGFLFSLTPWQAHQKQMCIRLPPIYRQCIDKKPTRKLPFA